MPGGGTNTVYDDYGYEESNPTGSVTSNGEGFDWTGALMGIVTNAATGYILKETGYINSPQTGYVKGNDGLMYPAGAATGPGQLQIGGTSMNMVTLLLIGVAVVGVVLLVRD